MNKELEALEVLLKDLKHRLLVRKDGDENIQRDYIEIVETALNRLSELEKENVLLKQNIHSLEELMKRPELVIVKENIQLQRDNDLLLINECSARQENKKLEEVLSFIKEHVLLDGSILRADFQWDLDIEENGDLLKEYLK